ncbi:hypothetical protein QQX98_005354 [Neonectria punicea]|uniref:Uncharacterized protein n=1 Tax=Neonectria punicea TaxID=979145 RepID=A0ABR1H4Y3_9HYPO
MCHAFLGYISQNGTLGGGTLGDLDTPPEITHLDYGASEIVGKNGVIKGEAGRWVENELFGGSLEFYRDHNDDDGQTGVPHVLDSYDVAWKINHQTILDFIENGREYRFPLRKTGEGFNRQERAQLQMRSLGNTIRVPAYDPQILFMKARSERPLSMDTLSEEE